MMSQHVKCWIWKILWSLGGLSLVLAWASINTGAIAGLTNEVWFWNALILGVLSISIKLDCHTCGVCNAKEDM